MSITSSEETTRGTGQRAQAPSTRQLQPTAFIDRLQRRWERSQSLLCVGLDTEYERLPPSVRGANTGWLARQQRRSSAVIEGALLTFNQAIIDATADLVCAFKPNSAFYEQYGYAGIRALNRTIEYIHARYPDVIIILDAKRGDMGNTSRAYARAVFDTLNADAVTLHPYLGQEGVAPFLERADKGQFIVCRTSNPGSDEFQGLLLRPPTDPNASAQSATQHLEPLYLHVARTVANQWNTQRNCGLVVGATYPEELRLVREAVGDLPILVPGVGAQGGELEPVIKYGLDSQRHGLVISASRSVIYASSDLDFAQAARREVSRLWKEIDRLRKAAIL